MCPFSRAETSKRVLAKIKYALSHGVVNRFLQVGLRLRALRVCCFAEADLPFRALTVAAVVRCCS